MAYTADKKPGALDPASTPLAGGNQVVVEQSGSVKRATLADVEAKVFDSKTTETTPSGTEVVVVRRTDDTLRQVALNNIVRAGLITNAMVSDSAAIADTKLATIATAGKVSNSATTATSANTTNAIVARDGSGNFTAGTITATQFNGPLAGGVVGNVVGNVTGNSSTASTWQTSRNLSLTGDVTATLSVNGGSDVSSAATIANNAVTTAKIADANVTTAKIADANVTTAKIADANVTTAKIADANVTTVKIANDAVTADKLDGAVSINQQTGNYTLVLSDAGRVIEVNSGSNLTVTIPTNATAAFATGAAVIVVRRGAGEVTIAGPGVTVRSADSKLRIAKQYAAAALIKIASDEWMVVGNLKT